MPQTEPVTLSRVRPAIHNAKGEHLLVAMPARVAAMESASQALWQALAACRVEELKQLRPTGKFIQVVEAMIEVRRLMGGEGSV